MPRRRRPDYSWAMPLVQLAVGVHWAEATKGIAQNVEGISTAGHSHRLTSGGKAVALMEILRVSQ